MQKKISFEWTRKIKKIIQQLEAAVKFGDYLKLGLGKPEPLTLNGEQIEYSVHITANVRLIIKLNANKSAVSDCSEIEIEGVCDYHGNKENWYIS